MVAMCMWNTATTLAVRSAAFPLFGSDF